MENLPQQAATGRDGEGTPSSLSSLIDTFCEITGASESEAQFYLESHNHSLDSAVSTYLETTVSAAPAVATTATVVNDDRNPPSLLQSPSQSESYSPSNSQSSSPSRSRSPSPPPPSRRSKYNLRPKSGGVSKPRRITTFSDLNQRRGGAHGSDSEAEEPQEYYTGGEKSGMLVQDPSKENDVDAIFKQARQSGGTEAPAEHLNPSSSSRSFTGTARLLSGESVSTASESPEVVTHNIVFWSNGFSVDDGPLRGLDDPENALFLESIQKSNCPDELQPADRRTPVHVNLIRKSEKYPVRKKSRAPFRGVGRTLASSSNSTKEETTTEVTSFTTAPAPNRGLVVDEALPYTSIQLRLADGTRMVSRFNYTHTIRDIRGFIDASVPGESRTYQLQTVGFPPKQLSDLDETIEQAGLGNSVVIQKL